jgi:hypothetical protein
MDHTSSSEANGSLAKQEISRIHKSPPPVPIVFSPPHIPRLENPF